MPAPQVAFTIDSSTCRRRCPGGVPGNALLPSDNDYGIPVLDVDKQVVQLDAPLCRWGRERRKSRMRGTWHFYTDDYKFARVWQRPSDVINSGCVAAVECNWSVNDQTPRVAALWHTYRKRWLARTWQDLAGIRIVVDLNVAKEHRDANLLGVPHGWRAYANRGSVERLAELEDEYRLACERAGTESILYVVYGGGKAVKELCAFYGWLWMPEEADAVRGRNG